MGFFGLTRGSKHAERMGAMTDQERTIKALLDMIQEHVSNNYPDDTVLQTLLKRSKARIEPDTQARSFTVDELIHPKDRGRI